MGSVITVQFMKAENVRLSEILRPACIQLSLQSATRDDAIGELAHLIPELADKPSERALLISAVLDRERLHTTGVGDGVALPHARNVLPGILKSPIVIFGRHNSGLAFNSIDGRAVKLIFLIAAPDLSQHLTVLARISRLLRDTALRQKLLSATKSDEVINIFRTAESAN